METGRWREAKLMLRFCACLQSIFEGDGIFPLLNELFDHAADLQTASQEDVGLSNWSILAL
jgi:nuclear cap-binding protein subunit 1